MTEQDIRQGVLARPISADRIQYFLIEKRPSSIGYEVPEMFRSSFLDRLRLMPKSLFQVLDPLKWHLENAKNRISSQVNFGILFDDYSLEKYDHILSIPCKLVVIFLNTQDRIVFQELEKINRPFLISSENKSILDQINSSKNLKFKSFQDSKELIEKILTFALNEFQISSEDFFNSSQERVIKARELLQCMDFDDVPNFIAANNNISNIQQLFSLGLGETDLFKVKEIKNQDRVKALLDTSLALGELSQRLRDNSENRRISASQFPTIILSYPYFNPDYRELSKKGFDKTKNVNDKLVAKKMQYTRFVEQNIKTYDYTVEIEAADSAVERNSIAAAAVIKQRHTLFLDFVGYLHSSFELSPYIRVPTRGVSLNSYVSRLSPSQYRKTQSKNSLSKNINQIGKALSNNLPSEVLSFIDDFADGLFVISDLPIEWLLIQDVPLAFLCDVCRVPETPATSILSQFNRNYAQSFEVDNNILENTLVVCGAKPEDIIFKTYERQINSNKTQGCLPYKTAHVQTKDDFFRIVNEVQPHLLIVDSHGDFKNQAEGSYIWFGNEKVTGNEIVEKLTQVPLVILSCCWGTPIYGNSNTIAQAFFERGSFSVLSTFLPISVNSGFTLYSRILNNLDYATKHGVHENWMNFVSHNIRTSYISDLFVPILDKFGIDILDYESYIKLCTDWSLKCMYRKTRHSAYNEAKKAVLECVKSSHKSRVERLLKCHNIIPEFMLYTHLGRGDLIKFSQF
jgi:hypothetical protein